MQTERWALVVKVAGATAAAEDPLDALNAALAQGARVLQMCPLGGASPDAAMALVILERDKPNRKV